MGRTYFLSKFASRLLASGCGVLLACTAAADAAAYSTNSVVSDGCHERVTMRAMRMAREMGVSPAIQPADRDDRALLDDLPFELDADVNDLATATVILGNRNVDLQGHEPDDLEELATVHGDPAGQQQHCLRRASQDGPGADQAALDECRGYIRARALASLDGLGPDGMPDPAIRTNMDTYLDIRGAVEARLPLYYVEIGHAMHALQDGFSHTYRKDVGGQSKVTVVLNYVEEVEDTLNPALDGPPHSSQLDRCVNVDVFRKERLALAEQASAELMAATQGAGDRATKEAAIDQVLTNWLSYAPGSEVGFDEGCSPANGWCDAPEEQYEDPQGCTCRAAGGPVPSTPFAWLGLGVAGLWLARRRRQLARGLSAGSMGLATLLALSPEAHAQTPEAYDSDDGAEERAEAPDPGQPPAVDGDETTGPVVDATPDTSEKEPFPFGVEIAGGGAVQNAAVAASLGLRYRLDESFLLGIDGEYNPWFSFTSKRFRPGAVNVYATGVLRFPLKFQRVNLRSTLQLGVSRMMFDLYGVPEGSIGPFVGFNLLGLDIELSESIYLIVNPAHIAVPIPQTSGVPYAYPQYRFTLGLQFGA